MGSWHTAVLSCHYDNPLYCGLLFLKEKSLNEAGALNIPRRVRSSILMHEFFLSDTVALVHSCGHARAQMRSSVRLLGSSANVVL